MTTTPPTPPPSPATPPAPPPASRPRRSRRQIFFRTLTIATLLLIVLAVAGTAYVYYQSVRTFEVRRVSLPTRIYTDRLVLQPGAGVGRELLNDRMERLAYREDETLDRPGTYHAADGALMIHLRGFRHPEGEIGSGVVRVTFDGGQIVDVTGPEGTAVEAALEPELLASILSDRLENRSPATLDQIPDHLVDAVIVTEDVRFWQHPGVDPVGIFRALFRNLRAGGVAEGGSTLTQQLVKNYYLTGERTFRRKAVEAVMAIVLDARYSKREILEAYLNDIYLGRSRSVSILGVGEASRFYFGKPVSEIEIHEAALIAGLIRSPNNYSPFAQPETALLRRNTVLQAMLGNERITQAEYDEALAASLPEKPSRERSGLASMPFYVDRVTQELRLDYGISDIRGRGLHIYTAIDLEWQEQAQQQILAGVERLEKGNRRLRDENNPLEAAIIAVDVETGEIRALVGGRDYDRSQFNRALNARRQVGSLFKPFVYLAAFEPATSQQNITPATQVNDTRFVVQRRFSRDWSPRNYGERYMGVVTVRQALEQSLNAASVRLGLLVGLEPIIRTARALGIESPMDEVPALILGALENTPIEMAEAYTTMARMGSRMPLRAIRSVADDRGNQIAGGAQREPVQVFPARSSYLGVHVMEGVLQRGTAASARNLGFRKPAAGKTGTTNDARDAWFVGFTPRTLALVWLGTDDNRQTGLTGGSGAVPIWARFMSRVTEGRDDGEFPVPGGIEFVEIDHSSGGLATPLCPSNLIIREAFKVGTAPYAPCPIHTQPEPPPFDPSILDPDDPLAPIQPAQPRDPDDYRLEGGRFQTQPVPPPVTQPAPPVIPPRSEPPPVTLPREEPARRPVEPPVRREEPPVRREEPPVRREEPPPASPPVEPPPPAPTPMPGERT
jgi:penicillin-binding protein 1B